MSFFVSTMPVRVVQYTIVVLFRIYSQNRLKTMSLVRQYWCKCQNDEYKYRLLRNLFTYYTPVFVAEIELGLNFDL